MAIIASQTGLSVSANTSSTDQVTGTYQFLNPDDFPLGANVKLSARSSATGMSATLVVNGKVIVNKQPIGFFGTSGALSINDHIVQQDIAVPPNARCELVFTNTTAGALTVDFQLEAEPFYE
jgi:hypothetical protein